MAGKWFLPRWWLYRPIMRLAHRFNWHWMPPVYPDGDTLLWCQWCGVRYTIPRKVEPVSDKCGLCNGGRVVNAIEPNQPPVPCPQCNPVTVGAEPSS